MSVPELGGPLSWEACKARESLNRSVYPKIRRHITHGINISIRLACPWVIAEQELSWFHDEAPTFCTTEPTAVLPNQK